jgi:ribosomal protein L32
MPCSTGKNGYYTEEEVQEALIRSHIKFIKAANSYYKCTDCGEFHLTSQGALHSLIKEPKVQERIKREQQTQEWEGRFRR